MADESVGGLVLWIRRLLAGTHFAGVDLSLMFP
jgi:hypothetical protein